MLTEALGLPPCGVQLKCEYYLLLLYKWLHRYLYLQSVLTLKHAVDSMLSIHCCVMVFASEVLLLTGSLLLLGLISKWCSQVWSLPLWRPQPASSVTMYSNGHCHLAAKTAKVISSVDACHLYLLSLNHSPCVKSLIVQTYLTFSMAAVMSTAWQWMSGLQVSSILRGQTNNNHRQDTSIEGVQAFIQHSLVDSWVSVDTLRLDNDLSCHFLDLYTYTQCT